MATATKNRPKKAQHGLADKKITDRAVRIQVKDCVETMEANAEAAREYNRAKRELNKLIDPWVQPCDVGDRLEICDGEFREIKLYQRDGFEVESFEKKRAVAPESGDSEDDD